VILDGKARPVRSRTPGTSTVRPQAGEPGEHKRSTRSSSSAPASRARPPRRASRARLRGRGVLLPGTAPAARTRSPRRAASTREELPERTATAIYRHVLRHHQGRATSAPARPTCGASRKVSNNIIDQCVAQGVPFARDYAGLPRQPLLRGAQVSRTFYAPRPDRPAAAPRRVLGALPPDQGGPR